jgi:Fungal specific transcription factor domain
MRLTDDQQAIRALNPERSVWILLGVAIRAAQSLGLHRDPSNFSVSLFEAEIRRRLWWYIVSLDSRTGEDHGNGHFH